MNPNPYSDLTRTYQIIATRRRTRRWALRTPFAAFTTTSNAGVEGSFGPHDTQRTLDAIVEAIRDHQANPKRSDQAIRTLAAVSHAEPDASTVLLHSLAAVLYARQRPGLTIEYRMDLLTELSFVLEDATRSGNLDTASGLARRLTRRAHSRAHRRIQRRGEVPWQPDWITQANSSGQPMWATPVADDPAAFAATRADLSQFATSVAGAIAGGQLAESAWNAYRNHRLARALSDAAPLCTSSERATASRTARQLQPAIQEHLVCHAP